MTATHSETALYRIDTSQNMSRYYTLSVQPNLFGGFSLLRNWGRIGTGGQIRVDFFEDEEAAVSASDRLMGSKLKRGYLPLASSIEHGQLRRQLNPSNLQTSMQIGSSHHLPFLHASENHQEHQMG